MKVISEEFLAAVFVNRNGNAVPFQRLRKNRQTYLNLKTPGIDTCTLQGCAREDSPMYKNRCVFSMNVEK